MNTTQVKVAKGVSEKVKLEFFTDEDFKAANPYTSEEREAVRQKAISDECLIDPLIIWSANGTLVFGYEELAIAEEFDLPYEAKHLEFESKADCLAWIAEKRISLPNLNLFQKSEISISFVEHWIGKDKAKHKDSPLIKAAMERFGRDDKLAVAALKAGTSHNTVNKVNRILDFGKSDIIQQCRQGKITITKACDLIKELGGTIPPDEITSKEVLAAEEKKAATKAKKKAKEVHTLAKYSVEGFCNNEKLDEHGRKFFVLRWNEENTECQIDIQEIQEEIKGYGK